MSFVIFTTLTFGYPLVHEMQLVQPQYSAQDLKPSITVGEKHNLSVIPIQNQINSVYKLQLNSGTLFEENSTNPGISITLKEIEHQFGQIDSVSKDIKIGAVKSELELDSEEVKTELTLFSEQGFSFKMKKELQMSNIKPKIEPVVSFKKSLNWFQESSKTESKEKKVFVPHGMRFPVPASLTLNSANLNLPTIIQRNEIYDSLEDPQDLTESLNSLATSKLATKTTFSLKGDLQDISAKLEFPFPGIVSDELELQIKNNLPEVLLDDEYQQNDIKSTLSLRYRVTMNDATKLEIKGSYDLNTRSQELTLMTYLKQI